MSREMVSIEAFFNAEEQSDVSSAKKDLVQQAKKAYKSRRGWLDFVEDVEDVACLYWVTTDVKKSARFQSVMRRAKKRDIWPEVAYYLYCVVKYFKYLWSMDYANKGGK